MKLSRPAPAAARERSLDAVKEEDAPAPAAQEMPRLAAPEAKARRNFDADMLMRQEENRASLLSALVAPAEGPALYPALDTWEAGIRYLVAAGEQDRAATERSKLLSAYSSTDDVQMSAEAAGLADEAVLAESAGAGAFYPAPDVWLAGIEFLREQGQISRAAEEAERFRAVYPDHPGAAQP